MCHNWSVGSRVARDDCDERRRLFELQDVCIKFSVWNLRSRILFESWVVSAVRNGLVVGRGFSGVHAMCGWTFVFHHCRHRRVCGGLVCGTGRCSLYQVPRRLCVFEHGTRR